VKKIAVLFLSIIAVAVLQGTAAAQTDNTQTFVSARIGLQNQGATYHLLEVFQTRGKWIVPDVGYIDFADARDYREIFIGGGAVLYSSERFTVIEEVYLNQACGPASGGAAYLMPWSLLGFKITPKLGGEAVYFPYLPLNKAGRIQHVLERVKLEYGLTHFKIGGGYGAYQFGDGPWQNKPFVTATIKGGRFGNLELWLQRTPTNKAQLQVQYVRAF